jgi:hypothetical protein
VIQRGNATLTVRRIVNLGGQMRFEFIARPSGALRIGLETLRPSTTLSFRAPFTAVIYHGAKRMQLEFLTRRDGSNRRVAIHGDESWHVVPLGQLPNSDSRPRKKTG